MEGLGAADASLNGTSRPFTLEKTAIYLLQYRRPGKKSTDIIRKVRKLEAVGE